MSSERVSSLQNWEEKNCSERARLANSNRNVIRWENESVNSDKREGLLRLDRKIDIYMNISQNEIDLLFILSTKIYYWINHLSSSNYPVISAHVTEDQRIVLQIREILRFHCKHSLNCRYKRGILLKSRKQRDRSCVESFVDFIRTIPHRSTIKT